MGLLLFADNCWIIAMSSAELQRMARAWNDPPKKKAGLRIAWQGGSMVLLGRGQSALTLSDVEITRRSREHSIGSMDHF